MAKERTVNDNEGHTYRVNSDGTLTEKNTGGGILGALADNAAAVVGAVIGGTKSSSNSGKK